MLTEQHRKVEKLFVELQQGDDRHRHELFSQIADSLAVHALIEERFFYPLVRARSTEEVHIELIEEHHQIKQALADLMHIGSVSDKRFDARLHDLKRLVTEHVADEEEALFPKVKKICTRIELDACGQEMLAFETDLAAEGDPRRRVLHEIEYPAHYP
jgi:hemerythrin superfamily protein